MSLKRTSKRGHSTMSELNITPLLDLVFVMLVIFIISTPQLVNQLTMGLPSGKPPPPDQTQKPKPNDIVVDDTGQAFLNNRAVSIPELKSELQRLVEDDPKLNVTVNGSDIVEYQKMIYVLDVLQQLEITNVVLRTRAL
jgi:biopolymer transport protein ExbD